MAKKPLPDGIKYTLNDPKDIPAGPVIPAAPTTDIKVFGRKSRKEIQAIMANLPDEFGKDNGQQEASQLQVEKLPPPVMAAPAEQQGADWHSLAHAYDDSGTGNANADAEGGEAEGEGEGQGDGEGQQDGQDGEQEQDGQGEGQGEGEGEPEPDRPAWMSDLAKLEQKLSKQDKNLLNKVKEQVQQQQQQVAKQVQEAAKKTVEQVKQAVAQTAKQLDDVTAKLDLAEKNKTFTIVIPDRPPIVITGEHVHVVMPDVLRRIDAGIDTALVGPTGCGKTKLFDMVAKHLGMRFGSISWTAGVSEAAVLGRRLPDAGGVFIFQSTQFLDFYENGGLWLNDEYDGADANITLMFNSAIANGFLPVPNRIENPVAVRHPKFVMAAALNTYGHGADRMYVGRNQLDAAVLDRFACNVIDMDYDETLEQKLISREVFHRFRFAREKARASKLRRSVSTRAMLHADKLLSIGYTLPEVFERFVAGWTPEEVTKVSAGYAGV